MKQTEKGTKIFRYFGLILCAVSVSSCTTVFKIELLGQLATETIAELDFDPRYYNRTSISEHNQFQPKGFYVFDIVTETNIEKTIGKYGMQFLYATFEVCETARPILGAPTYPTPLKRQSDFSKYAFSVYLPQDFMEFYPRVHTMEAIDVKTLKAEVEEHGTCLRLGAGTMHGTALTSNPIRVNPLNTPLG